MYHSKSYYPGILAVLLWRVPGGHASPLVLVDQDGVVNATYVPYAVLAALGYGAVGLAGKDSFVCVFIIRIYVWLLLWIFMSLQ